MCRRPVADPWSRSCYRGADDAPSPRQSGERQNTPCTPAFLRLVGNSAPCAFPGAPQGRLVELMNISSTNELNAQPLRAATGADRPIVFQPSCFRVRLSTLIWNWARTPAVPGPPHKRIRLRAALPPGLPEGSRRQAPTASDPLARIKSGTCQPPPPSTLSDLRPHGAPWTRLTGRAPMPRSSVEGVPNLRSYALRVM